MPQGGHFLDALVAADNPRQRVPSNPRTGLAHLPNSHAAPAIYIHDTNVIGLPSFAPFCSFEQRGYTLKGLKLMNVEKSLAEQHYADLSARPFFPALVDYIIRCVCSVQARA